MGCIKSRLKVTGWGKIGKSENGEEMDCGVVAANYSTLRWLRFLE